MLIQTLVLDDTASVAASPGAPSFPLFMGGTGIFVIAMVSWGVGPLGGIDISWAVGGVAGTLFYSIAIAITRRGHLSITTQPSQRSLDPATTIRPAAASTEPGTSQPAIRPTSTT
ncbi:MAG: hypothetical protein ABJD68_01220 [Nakamurella sp.]